MLYLAVVIAVIRTTMETIALNRLIQEMNTRVVGRDLGLRAKMMVSLDKDSIELRCVTSHLNNTRRKCIGRSSK